MTVRNQVQRGVASVNIVTTVFLVDEEAGNVVRTVGSVYIKQKAKKNYTQVV